MTNDGLNSLTYDAESRVVSAAGATYSYDGASLRVKKVSGGNTTVYIFAGSRVFAEYVNGAAVGSPTREYIYAGAQLVATHDGGSLKFHYHDHLSARVTSDSAGGNRTEQAHYPYGEQWYNASGAKLLFTSYERDSESGNDYAIFRAHIPRLGRFNRPDPLAGNIYNPQRLNRYAYVLNDVVNLADPLGLDEGPFGPPPDPNDLPITIRRTVWFIHGQSGGFGAGGIVGQLLNTGNENQQGGDPPPAPPPDFSNLWTPNIPNPPVAKDPTNCLIRGMLDTIAWAEGTSGDADGGYGRIVFGTVVSANDPALVGQTNARVTDFSDHPNALVQVNANLRSTAAGRYQFLNRTWESLQRIAPAALPNFGRASQDWGAVMLMAGRNMIAPLLMGNIRQAITNGNVEWASLPNSPHGQPTVGMSAALNTFNRAFWDCIRR